MSKKLSVGKRKAAMAGKQSATKRELVDAGDTATTATRSSSRPASRSARRTPKSS